MTILKSIVLKNTARVKNGAILEKTILHFNLGKF